MPEAFYPSVRLDINLDGWLTSYHVDASPHVPLLFSLYSVPKSFIGLWPACKEDAKSCTLISRSALARTTGLALEFTPPLVSTNENGMCYIFNRMLCTTCESPVDWAPEDAARLSTTYCPACAKKAEAEAQESLPAKLFCVSHMRQEMVIDADGAWGPKGDLVCLGCAKDSLFKRNGRMRWTDKSRTVTLRGADNVFTPQDVTVRGVTEIHWEVNP